MNFKTGYSRCVSSVLMLLSLSAILIGCSSPAYKETSSIVNTPGAMMAGAVWKNAPIEKVTFPSDKYELYMSDVSGTAYGWKFACFVPIATPDLGDALDEIWKESGLTQAERKDMKIVNVTERWGTRWSCLVIGQNYVTATGDIVKLKK